MIKASKLFNEWLAKSQENRDKIARVLSEAKRKEIEKKQKEEQRLKDLEKQTYEKLKNRKFAFLGFNFCFGFGGNKPQGTIGDVRTQFSIGSSFTYYFFNPFKKFNFGLGIAINYLSAKTITKYPEDYDGYFSAVMFKGYLSFLFLFNRTRNLGLIFQVGFNINQKIKGEYGDKYSIDFDVLFISIARKNYNFAFSFGNFTRLILDENAKVISGCTGLKFSIPVNLM